MKTNQQTTHPFFHFRLPLFVSWRGFVSSCYTFYRIIMCISFTADWFVLRPGSESKSGEGVGRWWEGLISVQPDLHPLEFLKFLKPPGSWALNLGCHLWPLLSWLLLHSLSVPSTHQVWAICPSLSLLYLSGNFTQHHHPLLDLHLFISVMLRYF